MSLIERIALDDVKAGQVYEYVELHGGGGSFSRPSGDSLRITRPARNPHDGWLGVRLDPLDWEKPGQEWLLHVRQLADGRYRRRPDQEESP